MGIFNKKNKTGGIADIIRCDQEDYLIWKWHPKGALEGDLARETAIRVAGGAIARKIIPNIEISGKLIQVGNLTSNWDELIEKVKNEGKRIHGEIDPDFNY